MLIKKQKIVQEQRDVLLRQWQTELNSKFEKRNIKLFVKTRSKCFVTYNDKGQRQRHVTFWLAFATTEAEMDVLKNEPHLEGVIDNTSCCGGVDEHTLCWHF